RVTKSYHGKLQTEIEDMHLPNPVIRSSRPLAVPPKSSRSPRSATTFRSCAPRASSPSSLALGAINFSRTDTRSAWSSSNSSSGSTLRLPLASSIRSKATPTYTATTDLNSTGSTNVSLTISTSSLAPSGSKRPHNLARKREQNLRSRPHNGLKGLGHNLPRIWSEWKSLYPDPAHTKFDGVITDLHPFEELRYPNAVLAHGAGVTIDMGRGPRPAPSGRPEPEYYLSVPEVDELVAVLFAAASVKPPYFTSRLRKVARDFLTDQNAVASSLTK